jgi:hypothetical protein
LGEYLINKENAANFKARELDKRIFEQAPIVTPRKEKP